MEYKALNYEKHGHLLGCCQDICLEEHGWVRHSHAQAMQGAPLGYEG